MLTPLEPNVLSERHLDFLLGAARTLAAEASTFQETVNNTIVTALPDLGDFGFLDLIQGDRVPGAVHAHRNPGLKSTLSRIRPSWQEGAPGRFALPRGSPSLHVVDGSAKEALGDAELDGLQRAGIAVRSRITVPMWLRGELIGVLTLFMGSSGRTHDEASVACARELATIAAPFIASSRLVEEHANARAALQRSEEFLRTATEAAELGLWEWDIPHDRITCSERLYRLHGLTGEYGACRSADFISLVHPDDMPAIDASREAALSGRADYVVEFRPLRADGRVCWLSARARVFRDGDGEPIRMIGATVDVTIRRELLDREKRARAEAENARQRLELLAAASARLAASLNAEATLAAIADILVPRLADGCFVDLLGEHGELGHMTAFHGACWGQPVNAHDARCLRSSAQATGSFTWCLANGRPYRHNAESTGEFAGLGDSPLHVFAQSIAMRAYCVVPLVARGKQLGVLAIFQAGSGRPVSEEDASLVEVLAQRAAVALDNARLYEDAAAARRVAEDASRAKDGFLAMLGHELRNPLAPIVTNLKLMALRDAHAFSGERGVIERQVSNLSRLVDDLLDVARITRGDVQLRKSRVYLDEVLDRSIEAVNRLLESRRHRLVVDLAGGAAGPRSVAMYADATRLVQVFSNILTNAARYTPEGGNITLRATADGLTCRVAVEDDGDGIDPDLLPRVFDLFFQGAQGLDRPNGGLGVGLALVKNLVTLHGGDVTALSDGPDRGSTFVVELPMDTSRPTPTPSTDALPGQASVAASSRKRILLVDDNKDALDSLTLFLQLSGHEVCSASDPIRALAVAPDFDADIAILDIGLPGMDGYDLAARLRAEGSRCLLVALTGYGLAEDRARSHAAGFEHHLVKPIDPAALLTVLG